MKEPRIHTRDREQRVLRLRAEGHSFDTIAQRVGVSGKSSAHRIYRRAMDATVQEAADDLRQLECSRLDALQQAWWHRALDGQVKAAQLLIKIMERRAKLLGLDAPARVNVKNSGELDARIEELIAELTAELTAVPWIPPMDDATRMLSQVQPIADEPGQL